MTQPRAIDRLWRAAHQLRDDAQALRLHAVEDRPGRQDEAPSKLVENIEMASLTLAGWVEETVDAAAQAVAAVDYPGDAARLRHALAACADGVERCATQLTEELVGSRRLDELAGLARRGGREERAWVAAIRDGLDRVMASAWAVPFALSECWRELAERAPEDRTPTVPPAPEALLEDGERRR
jgi:hypothetical protein